MRNLLSKKIFLIVVVATLLLLWVIYVLSPPKVVYTDRYAALYSNDTAEIVFRDTFNGETYIYRSDIKPLYIDEDKSQQGWGVVGYILPEITFRGGGKNRAILTYKNDVGDHVCDRNIFYVDRINHTSDTVSAAGCVIKSLDQAEHSTFWTQEYVGYNETGQPYYTIGVGNYFDGQLIASTSVPIPVWTDGVSSIGWYGINPSTVVSNREMNKVVFAFTAGPECGDARVECDTPAYIYLFDIASGVVRDVTPEKGVTFNTLYRNHDLSVSTLEYVQADPDDPTSGRFIIVGDGGYSNPYAVISVD